MEKLKLRIGLRLLKPFGAMGRFESAIKPIAWPAGAAWRRTMQHVSPVAILPDVDHPSANQLLAKNANPLVIESVPFAISIACLKDSQLLVQA